MNGYISILGSFLTRPIMQPQINTLDDIYNSPYPILVTPGFWEKTIPERLSNLSKHKDWSNKLHLSDLGELEREILTHKTLISFPMFHSDAKVLLESQKKLNVRGHHIPTQADIYLIQTTFEVNDNFPFIDRLNEIIHWMRNAGLFQKWLEVQERIEFETVVPEETDVEGFPVPIFITYGWILGSIVFVVEIFWEKVSWRGYRLLRIKIKKCMNNCFSRG